MSLERPIFVVGTPRSGTTLLRYALSMHPRIYIPPESNFFLQLIRRQPYASLSRRQAVQAMEAILTYRKFFKDWREPDLLDAEQFVDALPDFRPATLLDALFGQYAAQYEAKRWGDKSPIYTVWMDRIADHFPTAQFIHIIRDGRDVALSMMSAYAGPRFFYMSLGFAAQSWKRRVKMARDAGTRLGSDHYHELRYEALVAQPEAELRKICAYLGETYLPEMTEPHRLAGHHHHSHGIYAATRQPINTSRVGRWQAEMSASDQRLFQLMAGGLLEQLGYATVSVSGMTLTDWGRLIGLQAGYAAVELGRKCLQAGGVVHPAQLLSR